MIENKLCIEKKISYTDNRDEDLGIHRVIPVENNCDYTSMICSKESTCQCHVISPFLQKKLKFNNFLIDHHKKAIEEMDDGIDLQKEIHDEIEKISLLLHQDLNEIAEPDECMIEFECFDHINPQGYKKIDLEDIENIQSRLEKLEIIGE